MTTVKQLIKALKKMPQDAEVECHRGIICGYDLKVDTVPVDVSKIDCVEYNDPKWKSSPHMYMRKFVTIQGSGSASPTII